jgi:hypothetical protein
MPRPVFYLQIVDRAGIVVEPFPGGGALERDLIDACTRAILAKAPELIDASARAIQARGVGLLRTSAHVDQDIRDGMAAVLARVEQAIRDGIVEAIRDLKHETIPLAVGRQ